MIAAFLRYNAVQILAYGLDLGSFTLLVYVGTELIPANVAAKLVAGLFAFAMHKVFTFQKRGSGRVWREAVVYFSLLMVNIPVSSGILAALTAILPTTAAKVMADVSCMALTFLLTRMFVFRAT
jgi:Predicted membrane protein